MPQQQRRFPVVPGHYRDFPGSSGVVYESPIWSGYSQAFPVPLGVSQYCLPLPQPQRSSSGLPLRQPQLLGRAVLRQGVTTTTTITPATTMRMRTTPTLCAPSRRPVPELPGGTRGTISPPCQYLGSCAQHHKPEKVCRYLYLCW